MLGFAGPTGGLKISVTVVDQSNLPVPAVRVQLEGKDSTALRGSRDTDEEGRAAFEDLSSGIYQIIIEQTGFANIRREINLKDGAPADVVMTLTPGMARRESVEVKETLDPIADASAVSNTILRTQAKELPDRPATVSDALPLLP